MAPSAADAVVQTDLHGALPLLARGKVRDLYEIDASTLLFCATDRISAFDVILKNGIPQKGALLTALSAHWFALLARRIPSLTTHFLSLDLPPRLAEKLPARDLDVLRKRSMQVKRLKIFKIESIVRGYITGSAWKEYTDKGTICGLDPGSGTGEGGKLQESEKLKEAMWTPSTKAEVGGKDENIHPDQAAEIVGAEHARKIKELSLAIYNKAHEYALTRGIIIADTKFEFGLDTETNEVVLCDEVLTPDSSRFWPAATYKVGRGNESFDKQYLRDWLIDGGLKGKEDVAMPQDVMDGTRKRYVEAYETLTGEKWEA